MPNQDRKLVASKEDYEVQHIATKFSISNDVVLQIMKDLGKDGKFCRSRRMIYAKIREMQEEKETEKQLLIDLLNS